MRFRRIYWVTEQLDEQGQSDVTGVFTSIPDLIETGLGVRAVSDKTAGFRITLCELDCKDEPILRAESPTFEGLEETLGPIVQTGEVSREEYASLADALRAFRA
ncbi:MAG: hypothetical protein M3R13_03590 [Armatimonadota bacterium]|nr:hypothetical protein [Armatimonadota bacterium]